MTLLTDLTYNWLEVQNQKFIAISYKYVWIIYDIGQERNWMKLN